MDEFYKKIQDKLNQGPDFPFEATQWDLLEQRLDNQSILKKPFYKKVLFWLFLWALSLGLISGIYWHQINKNKAEILALKANLAQGNKVIYDTIYRHQIIHQYDTVYHEMIKTIPSNKRIKGIVENNLLEQKTLIVNGLEGRLNKVGKENIRLHNPSKKLATYSMAELGKVVAHSRKQPFIDANSQKASRVRKHFEHLSFLGTKQVPLLSSPRVEIKDIEVPMIEKSTPLIAYLQPSSFKLGINLGIPFLLSKYNDSAPNTSIGVKTEIGFGDRFSLQIGANFETLKFNLKEDFEEDFDLNLEPIIGATELHSYGIKSEFLQIPIGFKYLFLPKKRLSPYINMGVLATKLLEREVKYVYSDNGQTYFKQEEEGGSDFQNNQIYGSIGFDYELKPKWNLNFAVRYNHSFNQDVFTSDELRSLRFETGISYKF
jgi:hypothetical protein